MGDKSVQEGTGPVCVRLDVATPEIQMANDVVNKVFLRTIAPGYLKEEVIHEIQEGREVCQPWKEGLESLEPNLPDKTSA